jgi:hypothetical protein
MLSCFLVVYFFHKEEQKKNKAFSFMSSSTSSASWSRKTHLIIYESGGSQVLTFLDTNNMQIHKQPVNLNLPNISSCINPDSVVALWSPSLRETKRVRHSIEGLFVADQWTYTGKWRDENIIVRDDQGNVIEGRLWDKDDNRRRVLLVSKATNTPMFVYIMRGIMGPKEPCF